MIQFAYTILYVKSVSAAIEFYGKAFGFERKFITPDESYGELKTGATTLSFASIIQARSNLKDGFIESCLEARPFAQEIGFTTGDVEGVYQRAIEAGAIAEAAPVVKPHGQTVAYVRDPEGFLLEICTPIE